jgi:DNA-binding transcriptional MocR family regulator
VLIWADMGKVAWMDAEQHDAATPHGCPKYLKLAWRFERQLRTGVLRVGDRLPSVRQLRDEHRVSVATAVGCYLWLERQGYVRARPKSGFYVSRVPVSDGPAPSVTPRMRGPVPVRMSGFGVNAPAVSVPDCIELGPAIVGPSLLPMNRLNRSIRVALSAFADTAVRYEDPRGNPRLRRQIARLVFRQGASCVPDDVIVTSGATEALNLSIRAVTRPGDVVAVDSPGCYEILQVLESLQLRAVEIPHVLRTGIDPDLLAAAARKYPLKAIILNATCHNPFGDCVDDARKADIVAFATAHDIPLIEGDTFGDLVFSGERPRPLKAFDRTGIVLQCSSLAHYVAPGFNLGWSNAGRWRSEVERLKAFTNVANARLPQLAMADFLESGAFDKHVKQLRVALWRSVEATRQEVLRLFPPDTRVSQPEGGFVLWVQLPPGCDGVDLQRKASAVGINILPGAAFSPSKQYRNCIRIACGHPFEVIKPAVRTLSRLL